MPAPGRGAEEPPPPLPPPPVGQLVLRSSAKIASGGHDDDGDDDASEAACAAHEGVMVAAGAAEPDPPPAPDPPMQPDVARRLWDVGTRVDLFAPICDGATMTVIRFMEVMTTVQGASRVSQRAMGRIFFVLNMVLPDNAIPSYKQVLTVVRQVMSRNETLVEMCNNDCLSFRDTADHKWGGDDITRCPECGDSRYMGRSGDAAPHQLRVPAKCFIHRPVRDTVRLLMNRPDVAPHARRPVRPGYNPDASTWEDIVDTRGWHRTVTLDAVLSACLLSFVLMLAVDGFPLFDLKLGYSVTPILAVALNLPPHLRGKYANIFLLGIVPGPKKPKNLQPYLDIIVDDLKLAYGVGFKVWDCVTKAVMLARVKLVTWTADMPGLSDLIAFMHKETKFCCNKCKVASPKVTSLNRGIIADPASFGTGRRTHAGVLADVALVEGHVIENKSCGIHGECYRKPE